MSEVKLLGMGDSHLLSTGYANQGRYILRHLANKPSKFNVHYMAWHYNGMPIKNPMFQDGETINYWIHPAGRHPWGADKLQSYLNMIKPDVFFTLCDMFMLTQAHPGGPINNWISKINFPCKSIFYFPSDGAPFPKGCDIALRKCSHPVAMSKFAQKQVKEQYDIDVDYIPHCVDTNLFYRMNDKDRLLLRKKWSKIVHNCYGKRVDLTGKKILLYVARNQGRKFLSRVVKVAKELYKDGKNSDVIMVLKSHPNDPARGSTDVISQAKMHGLGDKICWCYTDWFSGFTITEMREIYNLADVYFSTSSGEGWGVPHIEAMSCELPMLSVDFTTGPEQVDGDVNQIVRLDTTITGTFNVERGLVDVADFVVKLQKFLDDEKLRASTGVRNREKVVREYSTTKILPVWEKYIERIVNE